MSRQEEVAMPRRGAAPGHCTTARVYRRDPAAPRTNARQEEAGRETSFLFYSNCHPTPVTAAAKCFQLPHEMTQGNLPPCPPSSPRGKARWAPALSPSLLPPCGTGAPAVPPLPRLPAASPPARCPRQRGDCCLPSSAAAQPGARCLVPGARHLGPKHPEHGLGSRRS